MFPLRAEILVYIEYQSVCLSELRTSTPSLAGECVSPWLDPKEGGSNTPLGVWGWGGGTQMRPLYNNKPNDKNGQIFFYIVFSTQKTVTTLLEIYIGGIRDLERTDPGPRGKKHQIPDPDPQHWSNRRWSVNDDSAITSFKTENRFFKIYKYYTIRISWAPQLSSYLSIMSRSKMQRRPLQLSLTHSPLQIRLPSTLTSLLYGSQSFG
jgi:hypothetical protein